jgi:hypothetical protein
MKNLKNPRKYKKSADLSALFYIRTSQLSSVITRNLLSVKFFNYLIALFLRIIYLPFFLND